MCRDVDYGCGYYGHHAPWGRWHHQWGCCMPGYGRRCFPTREEVISELEEYLNDQRLEIKGVEERITELKKEA